ncbi:MAG: division/cell wall cluster transcriptional repressor MraZ [Ruminococcaceae bacterium]|nr:division/cell wall cluster transcriptional repressor MraZ [Oscillospiraceae bacterium]
MLSGEYKHSLDPKNRIFIPAKHREELGESFVVAKSIRETCLRVYSMEEWMEYIRPIEALDGKDKERIVRALSRNAAQVSPDSQGRIVLTPDLIGYAQITKNAVVVGCGNYAEIWSDENYAAMVADEDLNSMRTLLESFGL